MKLPHTSKQHLFIYERREMIVLIVLCFMVSFFTFTLGVHMGKKIGGKPGPFRSDNASLVKTLADQIPNGQELTEKGRVAQRVLDEQLSQELQEEVKQTQIKLDSPRQVDLPHKTRSKNAGATTLRSLSLKNAEGHGSSTKNPYSLQIGSYPSLQEAKRKASTLSISDVKAFVGKAEIEGKGKWYRVYLGQYPTRSTAEKAGAKYYSEHKISSFIVTKPVQE